MEDKRVSLKQVVAIGGAFMGFVIGSSFASGQECMQYFTGFGVWKSVGGGIACFPKFTLSDGMSKCAVAYLAKQLAAENTHTLIDVFCISPGAIETPMFYSSTLKNMSPEERKAFDAAQAKKRLIQPSEIAFWLGELLRDESTLFHGANIDATMGLGTRPGIQTEAGLEHN